MFPYHFAHASGVECRQHCERVAGMASFVASALDFSHPLRAAMVVAALGHSDWGAFKNTQDGTDEKQLALAESILLASRAKRTLKTGLELAGDIVSACHELDESAEFAAFEKIPVGEAIASYLDTADEIHHPVVVGKLREAAATTCAHPSQGVAPVFPIAMAKVLETREESTNVATLATIASGDQALATRLLSVANSALLAPKFAIVGIREATLWLGVPLARRVLLDACVGSLFASAPLKHLWRHSQLVAAAMVQLAAQAELDVDLAYTAGLLHDIGRLVYATAPGPPRPQVRVADWLSRGFPLTYAETITYGTDHAKVGADLLRAANLPEEIAGAVAMHHTPELSGGCCVSALLFIAEVWYERHYEASSESLNTNARLRIACNQVNLPVTAIDALNEGTQLFALAANG